MKDSKEQGTFLWNPFCFPPFHSHGLFAFLLCVLCVSVVHSAPSEWELAFSSPPVAIKPGANFFEMETKSGDRSVRIQGVLFDNALWTLKVIDNPNENQDFPTQADQTPYIAITNGGYFHPSFVPLGLVISNGHTIHAFEKARLLSGLISVAKNGKIQLHRSSNYNPENTAYQGLQAGPFLVFSGMAPQSLENSKLARRTVLAENSEGQWALFIMSSVTLADAGAILSHLPLNKTFQTKFALNLDGGSSTTLWANLPQKPFYLRSFTPVRNYLGIVPREKTP